MKETFITNGEVETIYKGEHIFGYNVGRKNFKTTIFLTQFQEEYNTPDVRVKIDAWGNAWIKK
jgi:hypothetical protein